mgnify:CR=1 FL=1
MNIFKKIIGAVDRNLTEERDKRCISIATEIIKFIGEQENLGFVESNSEKVADIYTPITSKIIQMMFDKNLKLDDIDYVFRLIRVPHDHLQTFVSSSMNRNLEKANEKLWGRKREDIDFKQLDSLLREEK